MFSRSVAPRRTGPIAWLLCAAGSVVACQTGPTDIHSDLLGHAATETGAATGSADATSNATSAGAGVEDDGGVSESDSHDASTDGDGPFVDPRLDVGSDGEPPVMAEPCQDVDLLFVIDNSGSMGDEQLNLVASFPGFIEGMHQLLGVTASYHVGVVTTDAYAFDVPDCQGLGGLTVRTGGDLSSATACGPYADGGSFMTVDDDLTQTFACAAQVGIDGAGIERPMDALAGALADPEGVNGACNDGFVRDDALLVVVVITDEEDFDDSVGHPIDWYETVLDAKGGDEESIVVLSLIGHEKPNHCIATQWTGMMGAEIAPRLLTFTELFEHGMVGDVCAPDYAPFFEDAVNGIAEACGLEPIPAG